MATALDLITNALREIGVLAEGEDPSTAAMNEGFARLNRYLGRLAAENLTIYGVTRTTATLTANQASFTVGAGGNINIARPILHNLSKVNFIDTSQDPDFEYQLPTLMTEAQYQAITLKALTAAYPTAAYYSPTFPLGTLIPWPIPTSATLLWAVYHWVAVPSFTAVTDAVSLPSPYEEALTQNLALLLCPTYGVQPHPVLVKSAADSMATLKRSNIRMRDITFGADVLGDARGNRRTYDIWSDGIY